MERLCEGILHKNVAREGATIKTDVRWDMTDWALTKIML